MGADSDAVFQSGDQSHQDASILHVIKEWMLQEGNSFSNILWR